MPPPGNGRFQLLFGYIPEPSLKPLKVNWREFEGCSRK